MQMDRTTKPMPRQRLLALALVLCTQTLFFAAMIRRPLAVEGDNERYEEAGWNLATGRGYSLPLVGYGATNDTEVRDWVCSRHPEACYPDTTHPSALYMPGYSVLVATVYGIFGRNLAALTAVHLALLWALFVLFERLAAGFLGRCGYFFVMAVAATYPFLARQATYVMSDHFHAFLFVAGFVAFMRMTPGPRRGAVFGGLMALATLCRPYSLFVLPVIWGLALVWRPMRVSRQEWWSGAIAFALPFAVWTARNAYWFGRFLPLTTGGAGAQLHQTTLEWDVDFLDIESQKSWYQEYTAKYGDVWSRHGNQLLMRDALQRIHAHPWKFAERIAVHVPRVWITMNNRFWLVSVVWLGGLLVLGIAGAWAVRRDARFYAIIIGIGLYWVVLLPLAGEARRTLPLRLPMLLLAGMYVGPAIERFVNRRTRVSRAADAGERADEKPTADAFVALKSKRKAPFGFPSRTP